MAPPSIVAGLELLLDAGELVKSPAVSGAVGPTVRPEAHRDPERMRQLSLVVDETDAAILLCDADGRIDYVNPGCTQMLGYELSELRGKTLAQVLAGRHTDPDSMGDVYPAADSSEAKRHEVLAYTKDGAPLWISAVVNLVRDARGHLTNVICVLTDITRTKVHEVLHHGVLDALVREQPLESVMAWVCREIERMVPEVVASIIAVDPQGVMRTVAAPSMPEYVWREFEGLVIGPSVGSCGTSAWRGEPVIVTDLANDPLWQQYRELPLSVGLVACWSNPIKGRDGRVLGTVACYFRQQREPTRFHQHLVATCQHLCALALEREESKQQLHALAYYDALTHLPNRTALRAATERALADAARNEQTLAILYIDLDRFKQVNDTRGHAVGDAVLRQVARRVVDAVRGSDLVGRLAGDEFVAVLVGCDAELAAQAAERIRVALAEPIRVDELTLSARVSVGVALFPADGHDIDTLLRHADAAMYEVKTDGGNGQRFYDEASNRVAEERTMLGAALIDALRGGGLRLVYQPQVEVAPPGRVHGLEALLRWRHPSLGEISPARFIPLAEQSGLMHELGRWVLAEACRQRGEWRRRGLEVGRVAVNLSARNFLDAELPQLVARCLREHGLSPDDLTLEMTEGVVMDPSPVVLSTVDAIHALGVRLSLDDFGTGYSSLGYLHRLPIDELKLDKSFVQDIETSEAARTLTTSVLRIGESLKLSVVAEGVETEAQRAFLVEGACPILQGYLFARPMSPEQLEVWLHERSAGARRA